MDGIQSVKSGENTPKIAASGNFEALNSVMHAVAIVGHALPKACVTMDPLEMKINALFEEI
jgi:hypothetical protein